MPTGTLTSKGQITIPKEIRRYLRLETGHRIDFCVDDQGRVVLKTRNGDIRTLKGSVRSRRRRAPSVDEMNAAIGRGLRRQMRSLDTN